MHSISWWRISLPIDYAMLLGACLVAVAIAALFARQKSTVIGTLSDMLWLGLLSARLGFVILYFKYYRDNLWGIINIGDGGFNWIFGVVAAALLLAYRMQTIPLLRLQILAPLIGGIISYSVFYIAVASINSKQPALPNLKLTNLQGQSQFLLDTAAQKPMVVNLWASWCPHCVREMPALMKAQAQLPQIAFIFVNQGETASQVEKFLATADFKLDNVLLDSNSSLGRQSKTQAIPTTLFYRANGKLLHVHTGQLSTATLARALKLLHK